MRTLSAATLLASTIALAACGGDGSGAATGTRAEALETFGPREPAGTAVYEAFRQSGELTEQLTIPAGTRQVRFRLDCVGAEGTLEAMIVGRNGASGTMQCRDRGAGDGEFVAIDRSEPTGSDATQTISITGPEGAQWSVAVEVVP